MIRDGSLLLYFQVVGERKVFCGECEIKNTFENSNTEKATTFWNLDKENMSLKRVILFQ